MKSKHYRITHALGIALSAVVFTSSSSFATTQSETQYYQSEHQANLDYMAALDDAAMTDSQLIEQMNAVMEPETHQPQMQTAESAMVSTMSGLTGVSTQDINAMHENGLSWGQIGSELGLTMNGPVSSARTSGSKGMNTPQPSAQNTIAMSGSNTMSAGSMQISGEQNRPSSQNTSPNSQRLENVDSDHLTPSAQTSNGFMNSGQNQYMASNTATTTQNMQHLGVSNEEMAAATERNLMNGGVSGHGTDINSGISHEPGEMMPGTGGLSNGMPSEHASQSGESGGMGGNSGGSSGGGMGSSGSGMGGSGSSGGNSGGSSGGGMGGSGGGGMGGSGGGGGMM